MIENIAIATIPKVLKKRLSTLTGRINIIGKTGHGDPEITGISYDSRNVKEGHLFFALKGLHTDGHRFVPQAVSKGAVGIVHSEELSEYIPGITYLRVKDTREALSPVSAAYFDYPSGKLYVIGVTGTDGKSTTVSIIYQLLKGAGFKAGFISTAQYSTGSETKENPLRQSTPEAPEIHSILNQMVLKGVEFAVVEATSHGLSVKNNRLEDIAFDAAVFTNISPEHLDFHNTLEEYVATKSRLFQFLDREPPSQNPVDRKKTCRFAVVNEDDPFSSVFRSATAKPVFSFSLVDRKADLFATRVEEEERGLSFELVCRTGSLEEVAQLEKLRGRINLPGRFNLQNVMAALLTTAKSAFVPMAELLPLLPDIKPVPGRMYFIECGQPFTVLLDYAHTPGAFGKLFPFIRNRCRGRVIALFGSAGERDTQKRALLGSIASKYSDIVILTDEDPRGEDRLSILEDIAAGCCGKKFNSDLFIIPDREEAIKRALKLAEAGDTVLLLGKGHERSIEYSNGPIPWNEEERVRAALREMGYCR